MTEAAKRRRQRRGRRSPAISMPAPVMPLNGPAFDRGARQAKAIIQRMQMPRIAFAQRAMINCGAQPLFQLGFTKQAQTFHAKRFIFVAPGLELFHLMGFWNGMHIAPGEIAIDLVLLDALLQQGFGFLGEGEAFHAHPPCQAGFRFLSARRRIRCKSARHCAPRRRIRSVPLQAPQPCSPRLPAQGPLKAPYSLRQSRRHRRRSLL